MHAIIDIEHINFVYNSHMRKIHKVLTKHACKHS